MKKLKITRSTPSFERIIVLYKKEKDSRLKERYHALLLMHEYGNCTEVAKILKRERSTIQEWTNQFNKGGLSALVPKSIPGKSSKLSPDQLEELKHDILSHPRDLGLDFSNWEGKTVSYHVQEKFGVSLSVRACQYLLHRLGFSLQRPRYAFPKADPKQQEAFKDELKKRWITSTEMV